MKSNESINAGVEESTMQARKGAIEAVLALKDKLTKLNAEEFLRVWVLTNAKGDNYCCAGCGPAYKGGSDIGSNPNPVTQTVKR